MACRDCPRCSEPGIVTFLMEPLRLFYFLMTFWNVRLFWRFCPHCHHRLRIHTKINGRYAD